MVYTLNLDILSKHLRGILGNSYETFAYVYTYYKYMLCGFLIFLPFICHTSTMTVRDEEVLKAIFRAKIVTSSQLSNKRNVVFELLNFDVVKNFVE